MLIRKVALFDTITIGDTIIQVRRASDGGIRLAIAAPPDVEIHHASEGREIEIVHGSASDT
jgi:sRNA-binding carbon storage regulator CsrA